MVPIIKMVIMAIMVAMVIMVIMVAMVAMVIMPIMGMAGIRIAREETINYRLMTNDILLPQRGRSGALWIGPVCFLSLIPDICAGPTF